MNRNTKLEQSEETMNVEEYLLNGLKEVAIALALTRAKRLNTALIVDIYGQKYVASPRGLSLYNPLTFMGI